MRKIFTVADLAREFSRRLRNEIGEASLQSAIRLNRAEKNPNVCHSHDFCDANMVMDAAFRATVGRAPRLTVKDDMLLFNEAWTLAKRTEFRVDPTPAGNGNVRVGQFIHIRIPIAAASFTAQCLRVGANGDPNAPEAPVVLQIADDIAAITPKPTASDIDAGAFGAMQIIYKEMMQSRSPEQQKKITRTDLEKAMRREFNLMQCYMPEETFEYFLDQVRPR